MSSSPTDKIKPLRLSSDSEEAEEAQDQEPEDELEVEAILGRKKVNGQVLYLLKWKGFSEEHNSWEPETNLACPELIAAFEAKRTKKDEAQAPRRSRGKDEDTTTTKPTDAGDSAHMPPAKKKRLSKPDKDSPMKEEKRIKKATGETDNKPRGFDRGLEPEKILGATDCVGTLMFLMRWKGSQEADLVPAKQANVACPQIVIKFYEDRLSWHTPDSKESSEK